MCLAAPGAEGIFPSGLLLRVFCGILSSGDAPVFEVGLFSVPAALWAVALSLSQDLGLQLPRWADGGWTSGLILLFRIS